MEVNLSLSVETEDDESMSVAIVQDLTEREQTERDMRFLAYHDALTGLANRTLFVDKLAHYIKLSQRTQTKMAILFLDLDHFKRINDTLGHYIGDALLVQVAEVLKEILRDSDLIIRNRERVRDDAIARLGGDEFILLLNLIHNENHIAAIAQRIINRLSKSIQLVGHDVVTPPSMGIAMQGNCTTTII